jgi:Ethanolamine utilization protein EutJ (predicted chaperonin)
MEYNCPDCQKWSIQQDDLYCSYCGLKLLDLEITPKKIRFYIDKDRKCTHKEKILLNNKGFIDVSVKSITYNKSIFHLADEIDVIPLKEKKEVEIELSNPKQIISGKNLTITIEFSKGKPHHIEPEFHDIPRWNLILDGKTIAMDSSLKIYKFSDDIRLNFKLQRLGQSKFDIVGIYLEHKDNRFEAKVTSINDNSVEGVLTIHSQKLELDRDELVSLWITGKNTSYQAKFPFYIILSTPPEVLIMVDGKRHKEGKKVFTELYEGFEGEKEVNIINCSPTPLTIKEVPVSSPFSIEPFAHKFPHTLSADANLLLKLKMDPGKISKDSMESSITINTRELKEKKIDFFIEKKILEEFKGILAVDIGTTNTTIVYRSSKGETGFVPLEEPHSPIEMSSISPSVILYETVINEKPEKYLIGQVAKKRMIYNPQSSVDSIKTKLGGKKKFKVLPLDASSGFVYYSPLTVSSHIIKRLKEIIENYLKKEINNTITVITYPTKFSHIQIDELKKAFKTSGIKVAEELEESEAAALNYIIKGKEGHDSYVIGVFDCGGGTTDITMLEVSESMNKGVRTLDVNVLASDGDRNFGGNNMTEMLEEIILQKIEKEDFSINREGIDKKELKFYHTEEDEKNVDMLKLMVSKKGEVDWEQIVISNRAELKRSAEEFKIELSNQNTTTISKSIPLNYIKENKALIELKTEFEIEKKAFEEKIKNKITGFIKKMKRMTEITGKQFHVILLSGMSSKIPLIQQLFQKNFPEKIKIARDPKRCVALGALDYYHKRHNPSFVKLNFKKSKKLGSAVGIKIIAPDFREKFLEVFPVCTQLPTQPGEINIPLTRELNISVQQNLGTQEYFKDAPKEFEEIEKFDIKIPDEISEDQIEQCKILMEIDGELKPTLSLYKEEDLIEEFSNV